MVRGCALAVLVVLAGPASAALVVDASSGFQALTANLNPARAAAVDTDTVRTYAWSAGARLYDGGSAGTRIYGGVSITAVGNLTHSGVGNTIQIVSGPDEIRASVGNNNDEGGGPSQARALYLWDASDFLSPVNTFDDSADSSMTIQAGAAYFEAGGTRYVVRDGGTYFVSNLEGITANTGGAVYSINGASAGLEWAPFDPAEFASFNTDAANLGLAGLGSFSTMTFTNVTGVGLIAESDRHSFTRLEIRDFEVRMPQDTSLPGYGSGPFAIMDAVVTLTNGAVTLSWEAALNQRFSVERSSDLTNWTVVATNYPSLGADSNRVSYTDTFASPSQTVYRVTRPYDPDKKLNVLLLIVDDLRDHEAFSGGNVVATPNLDRLSTNGIKFSQVFCQASFCNPSRASFITGLRPDTTGIDNNQDYFRDSSNPVVANAVTLPQCFRSNGYYTVSLGKILHGTQMDPPSWDVQQNSFPATPAGNSGEWVNMTSNAASPLTWCRWRAPECADDDLGDGIMAQQAVDILREKRTEPFFLAVGFKKPHDPFVAPASYFDLYPLTNLVLHTDPVDASPLPPQATPGGGSMAAFNAMDDNDRLEFLRCYAACSTYVDAQVGKVLDAVDELGLWQNTIVMLWTDHGYHQGERGWWNKTMLDTYDTKVPLIAHVPQMTASDVVCTGVVELVDIYPTLAELAGVQPPANLEGESFVPLLENPTQAWSGVGITQKSTGKTVFDGRFRYTEWSDGEKQLFDHATDSGEWYNLASDPVYSNIMQALSLWLQ